MTFNGKDGNEGSAFFLLLEFDDAVTQCIQSVILAHTDILAGIVLRATLTNEDVASDGGLSTEKFPSESLTSGLTTVLRTANAFFMCHSYLYLSGFYSVMFSIWHLLRY